jgi:hypothetical protein
MRHPARTTALFLASILMAAMLVGPRGASIRAQVPAAAGAGVDPSKLPDVEGIHLGMSIENASAIMKSLFPRRLTHADRHRQ